MPGTEDNPVLPPDDPRQGATGPRGLTGRAGVSHREKIFAGILFLVLVMGAGALLSGYTQNHQWQQRFTQSQQQAAAAQKAAGQVVEAKLCKTLRPLEPLAQLKAPPGNPADNPSRAFEQQLVIKLAPLAQLGPDIGCRP